MSMANLQRMAQQMQQEMVRVQDGARDARPSTARPVAASSRRRSPASRSSSASRSTRAAVDPDDVEMLQDLVVAAVNDALRASRELAESKMARRDRRPAPAGDVGPPRGHRRHRAGRPPDRGVRAPARDRPEDRPAADLPPPAGARRRGARARRGARSPSATRSSSASAASTSATRRSARSAATRAATSVACASSRSRSTSSPSSGPASSAAATTSSTARSRRSTGSAPSGSGSASCSRGSTRPSAAGEPFEEVIIATNPTLEGEATAMYLAERLDGRVGVGHPDRPGHPGRRRPRVRRRGHPHPGAPGPAGDPSVSNLVFEILLRLAKALAALRRRPRSSTSSRSARSGRRRRSSWRSCSLAQRRGLHPARRDQPDLSRPRPAIGGRSARRSPAAV